MEIILVGLVLAIVCAFVGPWIAAQKGRSSREGFMLGFWLGPFGILIELLLPTVEPPKPKPRKRMARTGWQPPADADDELDNKAAEWLRDLK